MSFGLILPFIRLIILILPFIRDLSFNPTFRLKSWQHVRTKQFVYLCTRELGYDISIMINDFFWV